MILTWHDAFILIRFTGLAYAYKSALFGEGDGPVVMGNVHCLGDEENIGDCQARFYEEVHCSHRQDAGVSCGQYTILLLLRKTCP